MTATALLALAAVLLAVRAIEELRAWRTHGVVAQHKSIPRTPPHLEATRLGTIPVRLRATSPDPVIATIYLRSGRLVLRRRRAA